VQETYLSTDECVGYDKLDKDTRVVRTCTYYIQYLNGTVAPFDALCPNYSQSFGYQHISEDATSSLGLAILSTTYSGTATTHMAPQFDVQGKVVAITGGARGITQYEQS
jgi:hypothetical protein